jgi:hypothetical protein
MPAAWIVPTWARLQPAGRPDFCFLGTDLIISLNHGLTFFSAVGAEPPRGPEKTPGDAAGRHPHCRAQA